MIDAGECRAHSFDMKTTIKRKTGRPELPKGERQVFFAVRLKPTSIAKLKRKAEAKNLSTGIFVKQLIESEAAAL